jgi:nucleotide-binding universal stress UspA family protein
MKKFLFPTDFSANARHALDYGYNLARQVKANIVICNSVIEPAEIPHAGWVAWPVEESDLLFNGGNDELNLLKRYLKKKEELTGFNPSFSCIEQAGTMVDVANGIADEQEIGLVIIGTHEAGTLSALLIGDHSRAMINESKKPLLLVPPTAEIVPIKKIAFATDFTNAAADMQCIHQLVNLAKPLNAEILLTYIHESEFHDVSFRHPIDRFMRMIADNANYPNIYYREIKDRPPIVGLDWLCEHGQIDILAMVHRNHDFLDSMINGSQTQKMADHIAIPLLVFPTPAD